MSGPFDRIPSPLNAPPGAKRGSPAADSEKLLEKPAEQPRLSELVERLDQLPALHKVIFQQWCVEFGESPHVLKAGKVPEKDVAVLVHLLAEDGRATPNELVSILAPLPVPLVFRLLGDTVEKSKDTNDSRLRVRERSLRRAVRQEWAKQGNKIPEAKQEKVFTFDEILDAVEAVCQVSRDTMQGEDKIRYAVNSRAIAMYLMSRLVPVKFGSQQRHVGDYFNRDRTTKDFQVDKIAGIVQEHHPDDWVFQMVVEACQKLGYDWHKLEPVKTERLKRTKRLKRMRES